MSGGDTSTAIWRQGTTSRLIANAQGKTFKALQAEIEPECREEDEQAGFQSQRQSRAAETCRNDALGENRGI